MTDPSLTQDRKIANDLKPFLEAWLLCRVTDFSLTPGAVSLALAEIGRDARDRRTTLGKALVGELLKPTAPETPNRRDVMPIPKHRRDRE